MNEEEGELNGLALFLFRDGVLDYECAKLANDKAPENKQTVPQYLVAANILTSSAIYNYCQQKFQLPVFSMGQYDSNLAKEGLLNPELIKRYRVVPLYKNNYGLFVGVTDPTEQKALSDITLLTGLILHPVLISETDLEQLITASTQQPVLYANVEMALSKIPRAKETLQVETHHDEPIIQLVNQLIQDAIDKTISDIHIEPYEHTCRIRFRRDGMLYEAATLPSSIAAQVSSRLKVLANLNIAEKRLPQDGRLQYRALHKIDIRINTCPTLFGEKIVLRLLNKQHLDLDIHQLGFSCKEKALFLEKLAEPQGLILVTGPTGSGKTTTLYSALHHLNHVTKNIISIEDPVEIDLNGINQVNINPKIGLDFPSALRSLLRQDPDVIMIGEIRDTETAEIATQAAMTGHLVLSTLHTNSAFETIMRLQSMVNKVNFINAISLIIAQRLVRALCSQCKLETYAPDNQRHYTNNSSGCEHCHQGFQGRMAIFEYLPFTPKLLELIAKEASPSSILQAALSEGFIRLWEAGGQLVHQGRISLAELHRVVKK